MARAGEMMGLLTADAGVQQRELNLVRILADDTCVGVRTAVSETFIISLPRVCLRQQTHLYCLSECRAKLLQSVVVMSKRWELPETCSLGLGFFRTASRMHCVGAWVILTYFGPYAFQNYNRGGLMTIIMV